MDLLPGGRGALPSTSGRRLLVVGPVRWIVGCLYFREPLHADGVNLGDPVLEGSAFNVVLHLAISEGAFHADELPFLEIPGELGEISPGIDAMPFGASVVLGGRQKTDNRAR